MRRTTISEKELIRKGNDLNRLHLEYKNAKNEKEKKKKWREYYTAAEEYRADVYEYANAHPIDIVKLI